MRLCVAVGLLLLGCGGSDVNRTGVRSGKGGEIADARTQGSGGSPSTGGERTCRDGTETCPCYGNGTCNAGLVCASNLCVLLSSGTGGASAGGSPPFAGAGGSSSLAGAGGVTSTGGSPPSGSSPLGGRCVQTADCQSGLTCLTSGSNVLSRGGPSGGLCTAQCIGDGDCSPFDTNSLCVQYDSERTAWFCAQRCEIGVTSLAKCRGRTDMACVELVDQSGNPSGDTACQSQCASNLDCPGRVCDFLTGFCSDMPAGPLPFGSPCDPSASIDPCNGYCLNFYDGSSVPADPRYSACFGLCSLNIDGFGCGVDATSSPPFVAQCLGPSTAAGGDRGLCFQLCDCDLDCRNTAYICRPWTDTTSAGLTGHMGYCRGPLDDQGLVLPSLPCGP
jgi:hypothetical protein